MAPPITTALPDPVLDRVAVLKEASAIAAAYSAGELSRPPAKDSLAGRRFILRLPFGCEGPQTRAGQSQAHYEFNAEKRTVRLVARPTDWTVLPLFTEAASEELEAVEGFWVPHPWNYSEACPAPSEAPVPASPTAPATQTLGLARLFEVGGSRLNQRRQRPYEHVIRLEAGAAPSAQGYRFVLEGRFVSFPGGRVAQCWNESPDHRPICLYAVEFDRVAFESATGGPPLAEWKE
ncbi:MAG: hypothetical protein ACK53I_17680 [Phenylobacterium sp.]